MLYGFLPAGLVLTILLGYSMIDLHKEKLILWERMVIPTTFLATMIPFFLNVAYLMRYGGLA
jgi:hypothetical protein